MKNYFNKHVDSDEEGFIREFMETWEQNNPRPVRSDYKSHRAYDEALSEWAMKKATALGEALKIYR